MDGCLGRLFRIVSVPNIFHFVLVPLAWKYKVGLSLGFFLCMSKIAQLSLTHEEPKDVLSVLVLGALCSSIEFPQEKLKIVCN